MQKRSVETRNRILNHSLSLFSTLGYENTGVSLICERSNVSKGSFYHHFPTKHDVFTALLDQWLAEMDRRFELEYNTSVDAPSGILAMTEEFSKIIKLSPPYLPLFLEFWLQSIRDPKIWKQTVAPYQNYVERFTQIFRKGISEGAFRSIDPDDASHALIALALGLLLQNMMTPNDLDWSTMSKNCIALYINGLKGEPNA